MGAMSVNQIVVTPLKRISVVGGDVLHAMKCSDPGFVDFGEAYFSQIELGAVKAWKRHLRMTLNFVVPVGAVKFVFVDDEGAMREEVLALDRYARLTVPPGIWFGFKGLVAPYSLLLNVADIPHDPDEIERKDAGAFLFDWKGKK
jgi:dTDP-4-dehydrorhamnose 3,5-epimerase